MVLSIYQKLICWLSNPLIETTNYTNTKLCVLIKLRTKRPGNPWTKTTLKFIDIKKYLICFQEWTYSCMWPDLWKGTLTRFSKCTYFKETYFRNAISNLNQMWVFYTGGIAAAMMRKWSLSTAPSRCYRAEFTAFAIEVSFSKNGTTTKVRIFVMEGALDF